MRALIGSIVIHAVCGLALIAVRATDSQPVEHVAIELVASPPVELVQFVDLIDSGGGGSQGRAATRPAPRQVARAERSQHRQIVRPIPTERSLSDALAELASASREVVDGPLGDGDGGGRGGGHGRGIGRGVGTGLGDRASAGESVPAVPVAPAASKARAATLIYPARERDASEGELYSARVIIDTEGFVVGARLLHSAGPKDADAANMIFRFRYSPALDDAGRPIKSTIVQPFLVQ